MNKSKNNAMDVASFLLNCTASLPDAEEISAKLLEGSGAEGEDNRGAGDEYEDGESADYDSDRGNIKTVDDSRLASMTTVTAKARTNPQIQLLQSIQHHKAWG